MREADLQKSVMRWLKKEFADGSGFGWKASDRYIAGIPDIVGCYAGNMWAIELKVGSNKPTKLQTKTLDAMSAAGARVQVCYSLEQVKDFIAVLKGSTDRALIEEAIQTLKDIYPSQKQIVTGEYPHVAESIDLAIDALEKQMPKEPTPQLRSEVEIVSTI